MLDQVEIVANFIGDGKFCPSGQHCINLIYGLDSLTRMGEKIKANIIAIVLSFFLYELSIHDNY